MTTRCIAQQLEETAALLREFPPSTDALRAVQATENALAAAKARMVAEMVDHADHETEGYSSAKAWMRAQLNLDGQDADAAIAMSRALRDLPAIDDAAASGEISAKHVRLFSYAIKHIGLDHTLDAVDYLLPVACTSPPAELRQAIAKLREAIFPDDLEDAWIKGMSKQDIKLTPVPDGFHVNGFVNNELGVKFKTVLHSLGTPRDTNDDRDTAERRITGLQRLLDSVLANGMPADNGVRPHVTLTVDLSDLAENPDTTTAEMAGFGTISNAQLKRMLEIGDLTPILTGGPSGALDVGRKFRFATDKQKRAIDLKQRGRCAEEGCPNPIDHYHHVIRWKDGGLTDLASLIGVCNRTHTAIHQGLLHIDPITGTTRHVVRPTHRRRQSA